MQVDPVAAAARNISLDDIRTVVAKANSNTPVGTIYGEQQNVTLLATGAMRKAEEYTQGRRRLPQRRAGQARARSRASSTASRTTRSRAGSTTSARSCWRSSGSRTPTRSRSSIRCASGCRPIGRRCRPRSSMQVLNDRSISIRDSVHDVKETLGDRDRARHAGDLPVPAHGLGDHHPGAGGADFADRHLRGDVCARISRSTT